MARRWQGYLRGWAQRAQLKNGSLLESGAPLHSIIAMQGLQGLSLLQGIKTQKSTRS